MFNELIADVVNAALSAYIEGLTKDTFKLSLLTSNLEMNNVELYKYGLLQNNIPITIEKGIIKSIRAHIPWATFMTTPMVLKVSDVMISCKCWCSNDQQYPSVKLLREIKQHQINAHEVFKSKIKSLLKIISQSLFVNTITSIVAKAKLQIDRINVRIEFGNRNCTVFGFQLDRLIVDDVKKPHNILVERAFSISNISAYIDRNQTPIDCSNTAIFSQMMNNAINSTHDWIMLPGNMTGTCSMKDINSEIEIDTKTRKITLDLTDWQVEFLFQTMIEIPKFFKYLKGSLVLRNKNINTDLVAFWKFVDQTSRKMNEKEDVRIGNFKNLFKFMKKYTSKWKSNPNPPEKPKIIQYCDIIFPYYNIILWRSMAENSKTGKLSFKTMKKVIDQIDFDGQYIFVNLLARIHFMFRTPLLFCRIRSQTDQEGLVFNISKPTLHLKQINNGISIDITSTAFSALRNGYIVLESQDTDNEDFKIHLELFNENSKFFTRLSIDVLATNYTVDVPKLLSVQIPFDLFGMIETIIKIMKHPAFIIPPIEFSLNTPPTQIFLKMNNQVDFLIVIESLAISTSLFSAKDFLVNLTLSNVSISFGKRIQHKLLDDFNMECKITKQGTEINVKPFTAEFSWSNIDLLYSILPLPLPNIELNQILHLISILPKYSISINAPSGTINLGMPYWSSPLKLSFESAKIQTMIPELNVRMDVEQFGIERIISAQKVSLGLKDFAITMNVSFCHLYFFRFFEFLPKNLNMYLPSGLTIPPIKMSLSVEKFMVDASLKEQEKFILEFSNFDADNFRMLSKLAVSTSVFIRLDSYHFTETFPVTGSLEINGGLFKVNLDFEKVPFLMTDFLLNHFLSVPFDVDTIFPDGLTLDVSAKIGNLSVYNYLNLKTIKIDFIVNKNELRGSLSMEKMDMIFSKVECQNSSLCLIDFDLKNRKSKIVVNDTVLTINLLQIYEEFIPILLNANIKMPPPMAIDLTMKPSSLVLVLPNSDCIHCGLSDTMTAKINTKAFSIDAGIKNVFARFNNCDIFNLQFINIKGDIEKFNIVLGKLNASSSIWHILSLLNSVKEFHIYPFKLSQIYLPNIEVIFDRINLSLCSQTKSMKFGPKTLEIECVNTSLDVIDNFVCFKTDFKGFSSSSHFNRQNLIEKSNMTFNFDLKKCAEMNISIDHPLNLNINKKILSSILKTINFKDKKPSLLFTNETNRNFVLQYFNHRIELKPNSSLHDFTTEYFEVFYLSDFKNTEEIVLSDFIEEKVVVLNQLNVIAVFNNEKVIIQPKLKVQNQTPLNLIINNRLISKYDECELDVNNSTELNLFAGEQYYKISLVGEVKFTIGDLYLISTPVERNSQTTVVIHPLFLVYNNLPFAIFISSKMSASYNNYVDSSNYVGLVKVSEEQKFLRFYISSKDRIKSSKCKIDTEIKEGKIEVTLSNEIKANVSYYIDESNKIYLSGNVVHNLTNIPFVISSFPVKFSNSQNMAKINRILSSPRFEIDQKEQRLSIDEPKSMVKSISHESIISSPRSDKAENSILADEEKPKQIVTKFINDEFDDKTDDEDLKLLIKKDKIKVKESPKRKSISRSISSISLRKQQVDNIAPSSGVFDGLVFVPKDEITLINSLDKIFISNQEINTSHKTHHLHLENLPSQEFPINVFKYENEIFIVPSTVIINDLSRDIFVDTITTHNHKLMSKQGFVLYSINTSLLVKISFNNSKYSKPINVLELKKDQDLYIGNEFVTLHVENKNYVKHIVIKAAKTARKHRIANKTNLSIKVKQSQSEKEFVEIKPNETIYFVVEKFYQSSSFLDVIACDKFFSLDLSRCSFQKKLDGALYYLVNFILFSDQVSIEFSEIPEIISDNILFDINFIIREMVLNFTDSEMRPLCLLLLSNQNTDIQFDKSGFGINFSLSSVNLINKMQKPVFENVMFSDGGNKDFVIKFNSHFSGLIKIDYLTIEIGQTTVCLDLNFISQFLKLIPENPPNFTQKPDLYLLPFERQFRECEIYYLLSLFIPENLWKCFCLKNIKVCPTKLALSFQPHVENSLPRLFQVLPKVENAVMVFKRPIFEVNEVKSLFSVLNGFSKRSLFRAGFSLMRNTELMGLPSSNIKKYFYNKKKGFTVRFLSTGISIIQTVFAYLSNTLHILCNTENIIESNRAVWGVLSFISALCISFRSFSNLRSLRPSSIFICFTLFLANIILAFVDLFYGLTDWTLHNLAGEVQNEDEIVEIPDDVCIANGEISVSGEKIPIEEIEDLKTEDKYVSFYLPSGKEVLIDCENDDDAEKLYQLIVNEKEKFSD
ncbi:hypothetical protein TVAG_177190 [Trichomonas vaginalis G3]|uniref:Autophagy-related protein 2 n=1 Tax=Trichomonas vaginalis (strain ATCC PRA-98 / G3) TaxID=412133 RepID=A2G3C9_TRIV3|nr:regulation of parkin-mediated stimulation of mitophagy in response to mitochondrial depolarization [Trichomonas vaginalis G3]EAX88334.1 hypothetical protein TVAG_177190 [Trichomonas vaginalis G3]KAI5541465.1 regulation of parkin-mediated stimulation of mitophagy in response to mitochondrial depolarization [Trichomonas vaginalis G3]|eukprot:XP_001301264.1 hypothetical protein [Trichomonas vaginalis G3]